MITYMFNLFNNHLFSLIFEILKKLRDYFSNVKRYQTYIKIEKHFNKYTGYQVASCQ